MSNSRGETKKILTYDQLGLIDTILETSDPIPDGNLFVYFQTLFRCYSYANDYSR